MSWTDLLFLHWPVDPHEVQRLLPSGVEVDTFDQRTWIGLVPFKMTDCTFAGFGLVPGLRNFYECNVRVYVRAAGLSGVWFFSLDAANLLPVLGGCLKWNLNYVYSKFGVSHTGAVHDYALRRRAGPWPSARTHIRWRIGAPLPTADAGSLEHFLTERYWLFTERRDGLHAGRIRHEPWSLHEAEVESVDDSLVAAAGFRSVTKGSYLAMASHRIDVCGDPLLPIAQVAR